MGRLTGKVAIVTGAASGLGKADCEAIFDVLEQREDPHAVEVARDDLAEL